jgi:predicted permease
MIDVLLFALNAVIPILILILLGYLLRTGGFFDERFAKAANKLVFRIALPVLLFYNIYTVESMEVFDLSAILYAAIGVLVLFGLGMTIAVLCIPDRKQRGVVAQCTFRSNFAIIGLPLGAARGGAEGSALTAIISAVTVPMFNVLAVIALTVFLGENDGDGKRRVDVGALCKKIAKNPLIIGVLAGIAALVIRSLLPVQADGTVVFSLSRDVPMLYQAIKWLANMATPLALISLGGQFSFRATGQLWRQIVIGTGMRIAVAPVLGILGAYLLTRAGVMQANNAQYAALIALFGSPVAASSAIMASEMGNDEQLAAQYVVWTSVGSALTIFLIAVVCRSAGLL